MEFVTRLRGRELSMLMVRRIAIMLLLLGTVLGASPVLADETTTDAGNGSCDIKPENSNCTDADESPDNGSTGPSNMPSDQVGNPINLMTGNKFQKETDFAIPGATLSFNRLYNSANADNNVGLGQGWHHSYAVSLFDSGNGSREIVQSNGSRIRFNADGTDEQGRPLMRGNAPHYGYVVQTETHHEWHLPDSRTLVFQGSFLVRIDWPDQRRLEMFYRGGRLHTVTDETGRLIRFEYHAGVSKLTNFDETRFGTQAGHLASVTLPDSTVIEYDYDNQRNLSRVRYPDGTSREYHYESDLWPNHLTGITDRRGVRFASWSYDEAGRAITSEHAGGVEKVTLDYPDTKAVADGEVVQTLVTNSLGDQSTYTWQTPDADAQPLLLSSVGAGCATCPPTGYEYAYDEQGRLLSSTHNGLGTAVGAGSVLYRYDEQGRISEKRRVDAQGVEHLLEQREYPEGSLLPSRIIEPSVRPDEQRIRDFEYDKAGRAISITESGWSPLIDDNSRFTSTTTAIDTVERWQAIERTIAHEYDDQGRLISVDAPRDDVQDIVRIEWDENHRPVAIRSPGAPPIINTGFNSLGQVTRFAIGEQSPVMIEYNAQHFPGTVTQFGRALTFRYDAEGRLTGYTGPDGARTYLEYDDAGNLVKIIEPDGSTTRFDRNSEGRSVSNEQFNRDGTLIKSVSTLFDALGRVASSSTDTLNAQGNLSTQTLQHDLDQSGQLVSVSNTGTGDAMRMEYNAFGALAKISEPGVQPDENDEDAQENGASLGSETDDGSGVNSGASAEMDAIFERTTTGFEYDNAENEIALSDARGNRTLYLKDDFGQVTVHHSPDTGTTRYQYDAAGNRIEKIDADGDVTTYQWDAASRMIKKQREDGLYTYAYDEVHGKLSESVAPATTEHFAYDERARLISHERQIDQRSFVTGYRYDENGRISHKSLPDGQTLRYHYVEEPGHTRGNLTTITRETLFGMGQDTLVEQIDQDTGDGTGGYVAGNGLRTAHQYAPDGSISAIDIDRVMNLKYQFDESGRIIGIDENGTLRRYGYSRLGLNMAEQDGTLYRFEYDSAGNRSASSVQSEDGSVSATRYDYPERGEGNRLLGSTTYSAEAAQEQSLDNTDRSASDASRTAITDADVESLSTPTQRIDSQRFTRSGAPEYSGAGYRYEYNSAQRPTRVFDNDTLLAEYTYNGFGERIKKVVHRGDQKRITYYLYDGHQLTAEIDAETDTFKQGVFLEETPVAYLVGKNTYAVHADHLGTPRIVTDDKGEVVWSADYDPFGKATITTAQDNRTLDNADAASSALSKNTIDLPYRMPGQYFDAETGTHYNYYRDYDPATGRYITSDPIGLQGGLNTYAYAMNNPLGLIDPLGLAPGDAIGATGDSPAKPDADSEQAYTDKLEKVFKYALEKLENTSGAEVAAQFMQGLVENVAVVAGIVVGMAAATAAGYGTVAIAIVTGIGWALAGYEAGKFMYNTIKLALDLRNTDLCDEQALKTHGDKLADSVVALGTELASSALLGGLGKIGDAVRAAKDYASDGALTLWRKFRRLVGEPNTVAGLCSFSGDTLVVTQNGDMAIRDIKAGSDRVWARDEYTGNTGWRDVLAQYSNRYEETVHVTARDAADRSQTITSNRIHPYFARIAASALIATASVASNPVMASEGHVYAGEIAGGAWVDAQYLQPGDELLGENNQWQTVEAVVIEEQPLDAYNLSVDEYATYFVAGDEGADAVWVHNKCFNSLPTGYSNTGNFTAHGQPIFRDSNGVEVYKGHDGRFYNSTDHPPTENGVDGPKPDRVVTAQTELPEGYSQREDGVIFGPRGGEYTPVAYDADGYQIYQNGSSYSTFRDGKNVSEVSPRPPTTTAAVGLRGERRVTNELAEDGWSPAGNTQQGAGDFDGAMSGYQGQQGIDGIYTRTRPDGTTEYIIVETKATQGGSAGSLNTMSDGTTQQMSDEWIDGRIGSSGLTPAQQADLRQQLENGKVTRVKADVTGVNTDAPEGPGNGTVTFTELNPSGDGGVTLGSQWQPGND